MGANPIDAAVRSSTVELARQLIACRSITPADGGSLELISRRLEPLGFVCERVDRGPVKNLWARLGEREPLICFAGHVDVVPPGPDDQWSVPPFAGIERDGWLIGRGAADMKGPLAAFLTAVERAAQGGAAGRATLAVLLTSDEEGDAIDGTAAVVQELRRRGIVLDYCILGEPTSSQTFGDTLKNGRRGSLSGTLRVHGIQCHVAYPERGRNPVHQAAPALAELAVTEWDSGDADFGPTSFQISNIHAGTGAPNVVPGTLDVQFNLRFSPASPADDLQARIESVLRRHGLEYEIAWMVSAEPFITRAGGLVSAVQEAATEVAGIRPELSTSGGTSDGRFLASISKEIVEFGPLNDTIHKIDERVAADDLARLSVIYERIIERLVQA
jgi:succinyl-diaminopimelate desuccinylase